MCSKNKQKYIIGILKLIPCKYGNKLMEVKWPRPSNDNAKYKKINNAQVGVSGFDLVFYTESTVFNEIFVSNVCSSCHLFCDVGMTLFRSLLPQNNSIHRRATRISSCKPIIWSLSSRAIKMINLKYLYCLLQSNFLLFFLLRSVSLNHKQKRLHCHISIR